MKNKNLIIILAIIVAVWGIMYFQRNNVLAEYNADNCLYGDATCYYKSWPQSNTRKSNDQLFTPLLSLFPHDPPASHNQSTVIDYNGDSFSDIVYNYNYSGNSVVILFINDGNGGYDKYYKCAINQLPNNISRYYGDCADI